MIKLKTLLTQLKEDGFGATMNAQEMKRHAKKLAKLQKVLDKQGDKLLTGPNPLKIKKK